MYAKASRSSLQEYSGDMVTGQRILSLLAISALWACSKIKMHDKGLVVLQGKGSGWRRRNVDYWHYAIEKRLMRRANFYLSHHIAVIRRRETRHKRLDSHNRLVGNVELSYSETPRQRIWSGWDRRTSL